jgi:E3 ubiquitin-protein ligase DOA10
MEDVAHYVDLDETCFICTLPASPASPLCRGTCACTGLLVHAACQREWIARSGRLSCTVCDVPYRNVTIYRHGCYAVATGLAITAALVAFVVTTFGVWLIFEAITTTTVPFDYMVIGLMVAFGGCVSFYNIPSVLEAYRKELLQPRVYVAGA